MKTCDIDGAPPSPWHPEQDLVRLAVLGKCLEEVGELTQILARCVIQGVEASHPETGEPNRQALADELDDVQTLIELVREELEIPTSEERRNKKRNYQMRWYADVHNGQTSPVLKA